MFRFIQISKEVSRDIQKLSETDITKPKKNYLKFSSFINEDTSAENLTMRYNAVLQASIDIHARNKSKVR